ncbi:APC family permease [Sciscionella marina]|uniref:APC family permease n=1 Tax=Sciscionella marina TaxID=508770 RepID=UPI00036F6291|nr:amino acid permease [Sciscionella marina]
MHAEKPATTARKPALVKSIGLGQAIALYVGAVLGAGVLVLPGQAAALAGPASLISWALVGLLGLPVSLTFAALAVADPDAGGVASFTGRAFGPWVGGVTGWLYFAAGSIGQAIVPLTGGYYVAALFGAGQPFAIAVAAAILAIAVAANLAGMRLSGRVQLVLAIGVGVILLCAALATLPRLRAQSFTPFAPHGIAGIGAAAVVLFFAFAGWEAVTHLTAEFRDVRRDLRKATLITVAIVLVLYLGVALAVVGTGTYGAPGLNRIAVGRVLGDGLGFNAETAAALVALVICLGTTNAFVASVSRLGYALGRNGWLPDRIGRLTTGGLPAAGVLTVGGIGAAGLLLAWIFGLGTEDLVAVPSSLVLATYLLGMAAGIRLLRGKQRVLACLGLGLCALVAPFASSFVLVPVLVAALGIGYRSVRRARSRLA